MKESISTVPLESHKIDSTLYVFVLTFVILKVVDKVFRLCLPEHQELSGLDLTQHDETAYTRQ